MELSVAYFISCVAMAWLCGITLLQSSWQRFFLCFAFCADCVGHSMLDHNKFLTDVNYYVSGIAMTVVILGFIAMFAKQDKFTDLMMGACLFSVSLNVAGYFSYKHQLGFGGAYEVLFALFYVAVIGIFLSEERGDNGDISRSRHWLPYRKRSLVCHPLYEEAQT